MSQIEMKSGSPLFFASRVLVTMLGMVVLNGCSNMSPPRFDIPANDSSFRTRIYAGASLGNAHLSPDASEYEAYSGNASDDLGNQMRLGVDVHNMLAVELDTTVLGTSTVSHVHTNGYKSDVEYSAFAVSALIYGLNGVQMRSRREGWSTYGRLGMGIVKKSSAIDVFDDSNTGPIIGAGAEYGFPNGLGIRGELTRLDSDTVFFGLGAVFRFGMTPRQAGQVFANAARPAFESNETQVGVNGRTLPPRRSFRRDGTEIATQSTPQSHSQSGPPALAAANPVATRWSPALSVNDRDRDGVSDGRDQCLDTPTSITVDNSGCGLFDAVLSDVTFKSGSAWLTARARGGLDDFSEKLLAFPEARVQVRAHTDSTGAADYNVALSVQRAEAVVLYLQAVGISELQLEFLGMGEAQPLDSNGHAAGRRRNRRVEIVTLANMNDDLLLRSAPPRDIPLEAWADVSAPRSVTIAAAAIAKKPVRLAAKARTSPSLAAALPGRSANIVHPAIEAMKRLPLPRPGITHGFTMAGVVKQVSFVTGSSELESAAQEQLLLVRDELVKYPQIRVAVMAHTDDLGTKESNQILSNARADTVVDHLVSLGIAKPRLLAEGYGESLPLVQNMTADDRARNRRIELRVLR
ncbi:MAG: OmpA family protein [Granulosicoccus sp.]